jgi:hypothetical protein
LLLLPIEGLYYLCIVLINFIDRWQENFGSELVEGQELLCLWEQQVQKKRKVTQAFKAKLEGEYSHPYHLITYPKQEPDPTFGTSRTECDRHQMNLSNLNTDLMDGSRATLADSVVAWVKLEFARLPFVTKESRFRTVSIFRFLFLVFQTFF